MEKIKFKSTPDNYEKEKYHFKSNTVRRIVPTEGKFIKIKKILEEIEEDIYPNSKNQNCKQQALLEKDIWVEIENTETHDSFERHVTDITEFEGYYIISW